MGGSGGVRLLRKVDWNDGIAPPPPGLVDNMPAISMAAGELVTGTEDGDLAAGYGGGGGLILLVPGYGGGGPGIIRGIPGGGGGW